MSGDQIGEMDWMTWNPDPEFMEFINARYNSADTLLLGRKMADGFIKYWENAFEKKPDTPFAKQIVSTPKVVFTKTLDKSSWNNTYFGNRRSCRRNCQLIKTKW